LQWDEATECTKKQVHLLRESMHHHRSFRDRVSAIADSFYRQRRQTTGSPTEQQRQHLENYVLEELPVLVDGLEDGVQTPYKVTVYPATEDLFGPLDQLVLDLRTDPRIR